MSVEPISNRGTFGTSSTKEQMPFSIFLKKLQAAEKVYLTTQYSNEHESLVINEPLISLRKSVNFPSTPEFVKHLITAKVNLWLGASKTGTSSGLHHDFHDNIYALLSGVKRFRLFKPSWKACQHLQIHGKPHEIFENGLISYNHNLCSDGLMATVKAQVRVELCEKALLRAREAGEGIEQAEALYEVAMDSLLSTRLADEDESEDGDFEDGNESFEAAGDYSDTDAHHESEDHDMHNSPESTIDTANDQDTLDYRPPSRAAQTPDLSPITEISEYDCASAAEPPSFSPLSTEDVAQMLSNPELEGQEFELHAGQMLYLPASYFHEVISLSGNHEFHMAMNWWFYPPDTEDGQYIDHEIMDELRRREQESSRTDNQHRTEDEDELSVKRIRTQ